MRTEASGSPGAPAPPLTVWVGSTRYLFQPGRDVLVGYGSQCDIRLPPLTPPANAGPPPPSVVLRFAGTQWVAIDSGRDGLFVGGARLSAVDIRDGQAITIGDPRRGPRLTFNLGPSARPPTPPRRTSPTRPGPQRRALPTQPPPDLTTPLPRRGLVERMSSRKPRPAVPAPATAEPSTTSRLPLKGGARTIGVAAYRLGLTAGGKAVFTDVSFTAHPASLTAVVGPSAARITALLDVLSGARRPGAGEVTVDGHDVHAEPEAMRARVGIVSRDDRLYRTLTVATALEYAAELRLPPDTSPEHRDRVVNQVLDELQLTEHRATRIGKLPPEARRCAAMAIELVTRPSLLVVDEPGAGLDAAQTEHVMALLRRQADLGCAIVVAQASPAHLNICDQVLVLTSAGTVAFLGPPTGAHDWPAVLARANADPGGAHRAFLARQPAPTRPARLAPEPPPAKLTAGQQVRYVARRQLRLLLAGWPYLLFLTLLPFALGGLTLLIPGASGLDRPGPAAKNVHEAVEILAALNIAAVIMGTALTIGDLVGERLIFRREQAIGLSASAYLAAKLMVFAALAAIQAAVLVTIVLLVRSGPADGAALLPSADVELYVSVAATAIVSAIVGLALSSLGKSVPEVLPLVVPVILASLLFAGGLISLVGTWGYDQVSWFVPAQWGFAASASTADLRRIDPRAPDALVWTHYSGWWVFDMTVLVVFGLLWAGFVLYRLRPVTWPATRTA